MKKHSLMITVSLVIFLALSFLTCAKADVKKIPKEIIGRDGAKMVLIPAGEFQMGSNDLVNSSSYRTGSEINEGPVFQMDSNDLVNSSPVHTVYLDAFYMDVYEVTNTQYKKFIDATGYQTPTDWDNAIYNAPNQPVASVSWDDAVAYAKWAGKRLPTEAEWEKAARGGLADKKYPCGDNLTHDDANYYGTGGKDVWNSTSPVGSFKPNGYGLYDMAGNVDEWCADWFDGSYYASSPKSNPMGPSSGQWRVLRGGSWGSVDDFSLRIANRYKSVHMAWYRQIGFRCVLRLK